jgi:hypothetical protein
MHGYPRAGFDVSHWHIPVQIPKKKFFEKIPLLYHGGAVRHKMPPDPSLHGIPPCGFDVSHWHIPVQIPKKKFSKKSPSYTGGAVRHKMPPDPSHARLPPCGVDVSHWHIPVQIPKKKFSKKSPSYTTGEPFSIKCLPTPVCMVFPHAGSTSPIGIFRFKSRKKNFRKNPPPMPGGAVRQKMPPDPGRARQPPCGFRRLPLAYSGSDPKNKFLKKSPSYARGGQFDK